jgi:molybdenum cofactor sulfurtransferase
MIGDLAVEYAQFIRAFPSYEATWLLDTLRQEDYARLDAGGHIYLDYTGGSLYADSQLRAHMELLQQQVFGNPHSTNPTSQAMTALDEQARAAVLTYFHASPDEYAAIFTPNATGALKLVGEAYPFSPDSHLLLTFDNHNSANGIREFARIRGADIAYVPITAAELRVDEAVLQENVTHGRHASNNLFVYPAQSNFSGVQHPLDWIATAHAAGWDVLLDASAFVPTNCLDLTTYHPDFVSLSFYKMFGYPTGVGCLLARKTALARLRRPWFSGGTIAAASVQGEGYYLAEDAAAFEDGTINYLALPAVEIGLHHLERIGIEMIHARVQILTAWLLQTLLALRHQNGEPVVRVYGPHHSDQRGATIACNFLDPRGRVIDERVIEQRANAARFSLRTGCFCNPGAGEVAFHLSPERLRETFHRQERLTYQEYIQALGMESAGAVRISLGIATNFADVYKLMRFAEDFADIAAVPSQLPPRPSRC